MLLVNSFSWKSLAQNLFCIRAVSNWFTNCSSLLLLIVGNPVQIYLERLLRPVSMTGSGVILRRHGLSVLDDVWAVLLVTVFMIGVVIGRGVVSKIFISLKTKNINTVSSQWTLFLLLGWITARFLPLLSTAWGPRCSWCGWARRSSSRPSSSSPPRVKCAAATSQAWSPGCRTEVAGLHSRSRSVWTNRSSSRRSSGCSVASEVWVNSNGKYNQEIF